MWFEVFVADPLSDEVPDPVGGRLTITQEKLSLKPPWHKPFQSSSTQIKIVKWHCITRTAAGTERMQKYLLLRQDKHIL